MGCPKFTPKTSLPIRRSPSLSHTSIPQLSALNIPNRRPDALGHFATVHFQDQQTHIHTNTHRQTGDMVSNINAYSGCANRERCADNSKFTRWICQWIINHVWRETLELYYHRYMPKLTKIAELKSALLNVDEGMICHRSSLIKQT